MTIGHLLKDSPLQMGARLLCVETNMTKEREVISKLDERGKKATPR
jgi:hypothetical protein